MMELKIRVGAGLQRWFAGLGGKLRRGAKTAEEEIQRGVAPSGPEDEAEQALWKAMGWDGSAEGETPEALASGLARAMREP